MLTSLANDRVKRVVKLRGRRHRDREGRFIVEGVRELRAVLRAGFPLETVFHSGSDAQELLDGLVAAGAMPEAVSGAVFAKLSYPGQSRRRAGSCPDPGYRLGPG